MFLRAGYSANGDIIIDKKDDVIAVQERDVVYEGDSVTYVERVVGDQEFERHEVELGLSDGLYVEVASGIDTSTQIKLQLDPTAGE